ncbi:MAG: sigma 54-interacting transcriptional regulator, partial [Planctomycetes bacterium]|nr:sigma 54-interacting transcriptional regulator [Planctomycetota bacterium]
MSYVEISHDSKKSKVDIKEEIFVGRDDSNHIVIPDPVVSRHHAIIKLQTSGAVTITDLASNNGTFVNSKKIVTTVLVNGDVVKIGPATLTLICDTTSPKIIKTNQLSPTEETTLLDVEQAIWITKKAGSPVNTLEQLQQQIKELLDPDIICIVPRHPELKELIYSRGNLKQIRISQSIIDKTIRSRKAILFNYSKGDKTQSILSERITSIISIPLISRDIIVAIVYIDCRSTEKNFKPSDLKLTVDSANIASTVLTSQLFTDTNFERVKSPYIIGKSEKIMKCIDLAHTSAKGDFIVLITGETGTGKELIARLVHSAGRGVDSPFVAINCAAIPGTIFESELFGHEEGAFTGAMNTRVGKFELAGNGTIFLDEIAEIPLELQAKLLRAIEQKEFYRIGGTQPIKFNAKIVCATNRDLQDEVSNKRFRDDLYYRVSGFKINLPSLRERKEDIPLLTYHFIEQLSTQMNKKITGTDRELLEKFMQYSWPGNIRELRNLIERAVALSSGGELSVSHIPVEVRSFESTTSLINTLNLAEVEKRIIMRALEMANYKKSEALKLLGISWPT